ncbi:hypothetical protein AAE478_007914 [Parahypoxylon ruwenzoriense]
MNSMKEVIPDTGPEVVPDRSAPEVLQPQYYQYSTHDTASQWQALPPKNELNHEGGVLSISGLRRVTFWLVVALLVVITLALGLGLGLGLGLRTTNASADPAPINYATTTEPSVASSMSSSISSRSISSRSSVSTTSVAEPTPTSIEESGCPGRNGDTIVKAKLSYKVYCDSDLTGNNLASLVTRSLEECLSMCDSINFFQNRSDVGSVYNEAGTGTQTPGTCWCKGGDGIQVTSNLGNVVASPEP